MKAASTNLKFEETDGSTQAECNQTTVVDFMFDCRDFIDLNRQLDIDKLRAWCQAQFQVTFRTAQLHSNAMAYHFCCNGFSKRHFIKMAGHPDHMTVRLTKIEAFKHIETEESLFMWLVSIVKERTRRGLRTPFPSLNKKHTEFEEVDMEAKTKEVEEGFLKKRCADLDNEIINLKLALVEAKTENIKLLKSCKAWHSKYQDLLAERSFHDTMLDTPSKKLSKEGLFLDYNYPFPSACILLGVCLAVEVLELSLGEGGLGLP